jgi:Fic family protein
MHHSQSGFNERQRKLLNTLLDVGPEGFVGGMTSNKKYAQLTHISPATAQRDLAELVERKILRMQGGGA